MIATPQLEDGFLRIANELIEIILGFGFSHREQSVMFTIIRKTYGYGKKEDDMSASQIGDMCKIARQHVTSTLNLLALRNVINKRPGRYGSIIGIQKDHRRWTTAAQMKTAPDSPESGQVDSPESGQGAGHQNAEIDQKQGDSVVPNKDTCPELGLVPNQDMGSPESGQVDSPESGHTKDNLPKENHQKKRSCAPKSERDIDGDAAADRNGRAMTSKPSNLQDRFARFYAAYPKKKSRAAAEKVFLKLRPDEQLLARMIAAIEQAMKSEQWQDPKFIPYPATWLARSSWLDEIQTDYTAAERAVIQAFNDALGEQLGDVSEALFVESRAAAIRDFTTFSAKPDFLARFFPWVRDNAALPPSVGFDWLISRKGFDTVAGGQHVRKTA